MAAQASGSNFSRARNHVSEERIASIFRVENHPEFLARLLFNPEGGDTFLRNVG
jgi:hypothetical protein